MLSAPGFLAFTCLMAAAIGFVLREIFGAMPFWRRGNAQMRAGDD
jgi:hypothetical protein